MMHIDIISDLHLDVNDIDLDTLFKGDERGMKGGDESYLIVAGDLCEVRNEHVFARFFEYVTGIYKHIIYVAGNHEYYGGYLDNSPIRRLLERYGKQVTFLQDDFHVFTHDNIVVYGTTLWTASSGSQELDQYVAGRMTDYRLIYKPYEKIPIARHDTVQLHQEQWARLERFLLDLAEEHTMTKIVVTHHPPMFQLINPTDALLASAYASDLEAHLVRLDFDYWICGHSHVRKELELPLDCGKIARFILNPYGYEDEVLDKTPSILHL
jgi:predicted phosphohydrolase